MAGRAFATRDHVFDFNVVQKHGQTTAEFGEDAFCYLFLVSFFAHYIDRTAVQESHFSFAVAIRLEAVRVLVEPTSPGTPFRHSVRGPAGPCKGKGGKGGVGGGRFVRLTNI